MYPTRKKQSKTTRLNWTKKETQGKKPWVFFAFMGSFAGKGAEQRSREMNESG